MRIADIMMCRPIWRSPWRRYRRVIKGMCRGDRLLRDEDSDVSDRRMLYIEAAFFGSVLGHVDPNLMASNL